VVPRFEKKSLVKDSEEDFLGGGEALAKVQPSVDSNGRVSRFGVGGNERMAGGIEGHNRLEDGKTGRVCGRKAVSGSIGGAASVEGGDSEACRRCGFPRGETFGCSAPMTMDGPKRRRAAAPRFSAFGEGEAAWSN